MSTAILIPAMRPAKLAPLVANITEATPEPHAVYIIATPELAHAADRMGDLTGAHLILDEGASWAKRINLGYRETTEPYLFTGADDVLFHPGWLSAALAVCDENVVIVNDLHNPHGTMALVARTYADLGTIDGAPGLLHEGYRHNYVDGELFGTARSRGRLVQCPEAIVEHLHPAAGKAQDDQVYEIGREAWDDDTELYNRRLHLWA
jgi:hypothetical protein